MNVMRALLGIAAFFVLGACSKEDEGCTDPLALNYDASALTDDGSCYYDGPGVQLPPDNFSGDLYTSFSENWDDWDFILNGISGSVYTSFSENWDDWDFNIGGINGSISTSFSENWDDWNLTTSNFSISIYTSYSENWDDWEVNDDNSSWSADVYTSYSENWDDWDADSDSLDLDIYTSFSENWDDWNVTGFCGTTIPMEHRIAVLFVPVIVNVLRVQEIIP
jgi:hypothetical protein